ncbi:MAG TPA: hypothetical protein VKZ68_11500 [Ohtaekwangia sp.]|nr:hypothetical protein [Ohtaekwangia sp.]
MRSQRQNWLLIVICVLVSCRNDSGKREIQSLNKEKFSSREKRDEAKFLVDVIDKSHALLQLGSLGEQQLPDTMERKLAHEFVERHRKVTLRLKTYAESIDITIPLSGQFDSTRNFERFAGMLPEKLNDAWNTQVSKLNSRLLDDLRKYRNEASDSLRVLLDTTTHLMSRNSVLLDSLRKH